MHLGLMTLGSVRYGRRIFCHIKKSKKSSRVIMRQPWNKTLHILYTVCRICDRLLLENCFQRNLSLKCVYCLRRERLV